MMEKFHTVKKGTQNEGKYIALKEIKKVPKEELLIPYVFKKGLNWVMDYVSETTVNICKISCSIGNISKETIEKYIQNQG